MQGCLLCGQQQRLTASAKWQQRLHPSGFPGFTEYIKENNIKAKAVYLSLGDREEKTRNPVMATVGHAIRSVHETISDSGINTILEWNQGNHFKDVDIRMAKALTWSIRATVHG